MRRSAGRFRHRVRATASPEEIGAFNEHRLVPKPIRRRVWAPIGARPIALGHHRCQWSYVVAFFLPDGIKFSICRPTPRYPAGRAPLPARR
jgi:hypothetical protein